MRRLARPPLNVEIAVHRLAEPERDWCALCGEWSARSQPVALEAQGRPWGTAVIRRCPDCGSVW